MPRSVFRSKDFQRYFFTYAVIFACVIAISLSVIAAISVREREKADMLQNSARGEKISNELDNIWESAIEASNFLNNSSWVQKYMSETDVFSVDFGSLQKQELSKTLAALSASNDLFRDIAVIYPQKRTAATAAGWFSLAEYEYYAGWRFGTPENFLNDYIFSKDKYFGALLPSEFAYSNQSYIVYVQQLDIIAQPRAYSAVFIDKAALQSLLGHLFDENITGFCLNGAEGQTFFSFGTVLEAKNIHRFNFESKSMMLSYGIYFEETGTKILFPLGVAATVMLLMLTSIAVSYFLAVMQYSPLSRIIKKISGKKQELYSERPAAVQSLEECVNDLYESKESLSQAISSYRFALRTQTITQLLRGYFPSDTAAAQAESKLSYSYWYMVFLFKLPEPAITQEDNLENTQSRLQSLIALDKALEKAAYGQNHFELVENVEGAAVVIAEFSYCPKQSLIDEMSDNLWAALIDSDCECMLCVSRPHNGLAGVGAAYQEAKETALRSTFKIAVRYPMENQPYYYPLDWESQLVRAVINADKKLAVAILRQLYKENKELNLPVAQVQRVARLLYETMLRIARESDIPEELVDPFEEPGYVQPEEKLFDIAAATVAKICGEIERKRQESTHDVNSEILKYVDSNIYDVELSLNVLSELFKCSNATISRIFKTASGSTFHNYITKRRMEKAQELLRLRGYCPKEIAAEIGYDNEYSFKRAFIREFNMHPRDYAQKAVKKYE